MDILWAPWRMEYILSDKQSQACIFCEKPRLADREALIVARAERAFVMLNRYPYNNGHLLVAPYRHAASIEDLPSEDAHALMDLLMRSVAVLRRAFKPQGFNVGLNLGAVAGAGFESHVHFHAVPRWSGDTNFMPVVAGAHVIPEALLSTFEKLHPLFANEAREEKEEKEGKGG